MKSIPVRPVSAPWKDSEMRHLETIAASIWLPAAFVLAFGLAPVAAQDAEDDDLHLGAIEYEISCLPCHGIDGRGDGPAAEHLEPRPTDLTAIARLNDGEFPAEGLALVIDGRAIVAAHGARTMPVWGERYRAPIPGVDDQDSAESDAQARIAALVRYIETLQEP